MVASASKVRATVCALRQVQHTHSTQARTMFLSSREVVDNILATGRDREPTSGPRAPYTESPACPDGVRVGCPDKNSQRACPDRL